MTEPATVYRTVHEQRVELVAKAIAEQSALDHEAAVALARHVLQALDHVPEKVR
ncbi:DUF6307 family protein [Pseudonocardia sp. T1-2H]|uniref:DUF6307 family protein n=1 Tax=Pseudonocardia sp. T1-2H TaxID=3128899 RepID=UPI00310190DD